MTDFDIQDDLQVGENYPVQDIGPKPPAPGNYRVKVSRWEFAKRKTGEMIFWKEKYPLFQLQMAEITDPIDNARKVALYQDVPTTTFEREGKLASQAADLLRSFDADAEAGNTGEVITQVTTRLNGEEEFLARLDYTGYDGEFIRGAIADAGGAQALTSQQKNEIYNKGKVRGYRNIQKANTLAGQPSLPAHKWVGPSGNVIDARPTLTAFYPSNETITLGPDKAFRS